VTADILFVGATRPPMRWGVTYAALLATLLMCAPVHGVCALLCARDPRFFDLLLLWGRTRLSALVTTLRLWQASSYTPLRLDLPDARGRRSTRSAALQLGPLC
jgi:type IV secretion system protein VirB3